MSATSAFIMFAIFCATLAASYAAGYAARAMRERYSIQDAASQAADLRAKCEEVNADKAKFLAFAGAKSFEEIQADKLDELFESLERKARR